MSGGGTGTKAIGPAGSGGIVVAPAIEPVSLLEIKQHLRLDSGGAYGEVTPESAEDDLLLAIITAAREYVETFTHRALITQTWDMSLDCWPDKGFIRIPFGNLQTVTHIKYKGSDWASVADDATLTEGPGEDYIVETNGAGIGRVVLPYGVSWPSSTLYPSNPITIRFVCGYGATAATVDQTIRTAIKMVAGDLWAYREAKLDKEAYKNPAVEALLWTRRIWV